MTAQVLSALLTFNAAVVEFRGHERIFVGAQYADDFSAMAWTKCVPDSGVFIVQASNKIIGQSPLQLRWIAAHEVCHARLHKEILCSGVYQQLVRVRREEMETEAERCAAELFNPDLDLE